MVVLLCALGATNSPILAQKTVSPGGGEATGPAGTVSYTIGQIDYVTQTGSAGSVAQGVQQPWEISVVTNLTEDRLDLKVEAYPNPVAERLILELEELGTGVYHYQLTDLQGQELLSGPIASNRTVLSVSSLAAGTYLLTVAHNQRLLKTFKIIKPN